MNNERQLYYLSLIMYTVVLAWALLMNLNIFHIITIMVLTVGYGYIKFKNYKLTYSLLK